MQRQLQPFHTGSGAQLPAAILPLAAAPRHQLLGASSNLTPSSGGARFPKTLWSPGGHRQGRAAAQLWGQGVRHRTVTQLPPGALSSQPPVAAGHGAGKGPSTQSSARSQVSRAGSQDPGTQPSCEHHQGMQSLLTRHINSPYSNTTNAPGSFLQHP